MSEPKVVFVYDPEGYDVYIGRGRDPHTGQFPLTNWGNKYSHKEGTMAEFRVDTVEDAVAFHRAAVELDPAMIAKIKRELKGKTLGCWCNSPKRKDKRRLPCHGDTLLEIANS